MTFTLKKKKSDLLGVSRTGLSVVHTTKSEQLRMQSNVTIYAIFLTNRLKTNPPVLSFAIIQSGWESSSYHTKSS